MECKRRLYYKKRKCVGVKERKIEMLYLNYFPCSLFFPFFSFFLLFLFFSFSSFFPKQREFFAILGHDDGNRRFVARRKRKKKKTNRIHTIIFSYDRKIFVHPPPSFDTTNFA